MGRVYGEIRGYPVGSTFASRQEAAEAGVHRNPQTGIVGGKDGAESVVLAGRYRNLDYGEVIIYTGEGGRDQNTGRRNGPQKLTKGNLGLSRNIDTGRPVRLIRGANAKTRYSPQQGYRYDGLYRVTEAWHDDEEGWLSWRFRFEAIGEISPAAPVDTPRTEHAIVDIGFPVRRIERQVYVQLRDPKNAQKVKDIYGHQCQICGTQMHTPTGKYAEAAHIRGLGAPHDGPDTLGNLLCLCPTHHVLFDRGAISIQPDLTVIDVSTAERISDLIVASSHSIDRDHLRYHAEHVVVPRDEWAYRPTVQKE